VTDDGPVLEGDPTDRFDDVVAMAHRHALDAATCRSSNDAGRRQELQRRLDAVTAELERLRALPELKVGQRLRHTARTVRGSSGTVQPADAVVATDTIQEAPTVGAVIVVRNRRVALTTLIDRHLDPSSVSIEVIDDAGSDPATARMLDTLGVPVRRLESPLGSAGPWATGAMAAQLAARPTLLVTGDAVPGPSCPDDVIDRMRWELGRAPGVGAVGLRVAPDGHGIPPVFRLYRPGTGPGDPVQMLPEPYVGVVLRETPDDPGERFARLHDSL